MPSVKKILPDLAFLSPYSSHPHVYSTDKCSSTTEQLLTLQLPDVRHFFKPIEVITAYDYRQFQKFYIVW